MKQFQMREIKEAYAHAADGGQALHLHTLTQGHPLFGRYSVIAHLFDQDKKRLVTTVRSLGVNVIKVEREGTPQQHIDLCGGPLERAKALCNRKPHPIYTCGYSGHSPAQLKSAAEAMGALVVDIRHKPVSRIPGWNLSELHDTIDSKRALVMHMADLGNLAMSVGGPMRLVNAARGIEALLRFRNDRPLILLCGCTEFGLCHRSLVSRLLADKGVQTQELEWPELEGGDFKAISLWQPWASLIAIGAKRVETRGWATSYRGPLVIHAAKKTTELFASAMPFFYEAFDRAGMWTIPEAQTENFGERVLKSTFIHDLTNKQRLEWLPLPLGGVVAVADLVDCVLTRQIVGDLSDEERAFGDYDAGRYGWVLENVRALKEPVPYRGAQQIFNVPRSVLEGAFA